jgi:preprotein translocase subunit SecA
MNEQREIIYNERNKIIDGADLRDSVFAMIKAVTNRAVEIYAAPDTEADEWDFTGLNEYLLPIFHKPAAVYDDTEKDSLTRENLQAFLFETAVKRYEERERQITPELMRKLERIIMMWAIDQKWMNHIDNMDQMRQGITLRAYAQRDPLIEYKFQGYEMFDEMSESIQLDTIRGLFNVHIAKQPEMAQVVKREEMSTNVDESAVKKPKRRDVSKVGRNDPCPCGSGKKFKQCCVNKAG